MSRFKFRFWIKNVSKMCDWVTAKKECDRLSLFEMDNFITMQFTGLRDKNGVEIYEGDILREVPKDDWEKENYACFEVFFHDGDAASNYDIGYTMDRMHCHGAVAGGTVLSFKPKTVSKMIVIGNIYENKELLK